MKTEYIKTIGLSLTMLLLGAILPLQASKSPGFITISGIVKDQSSKKNIEYVNITVSNTSIGTVTNADGGFMIKVGDSIASKTLEISCLGYRTQRVPFHNDDMKDITILLTPNANNLPEVIVRGIDPLRLIKEAVDKIAKNNSASSNLLTGFYRETVRKRRNYINVTEAIVNIYKTPYTENTDRDRVQVHKGRQLLSPKTSDTLIVKLQGGPYYSVLLDVVKNPDILFGAESIRDYRFKMESSVMLDERPNYVVSFEPNVVQPYPLFYGTIYIDEATLTIAQVEFNFSMKDRNKVTQAILKKKPFNLRFKPEEITYLVTYKQENGVSYLNYIRNLIRFKCDWTRKLFSTSYTVVSEMVVTDKRLKDVPTIPFKEAFGSKTILSDKVSNFYDEDFWEGYNIIAPTESLESAVNKLKKQY